MEGQRLGREEWESERLRLTSKKSSSERWVAGIGASSGITLASYRLDWGRFISAIPLGREKLFL